MRKFVIVMAAALAGLVAEAEFATDWSSGWRLTVGPQFNFNASGRVGLKPGAVSRPGPVSTGNKAQAQAAGDAIAVGDGRTEFPNGGYVDPSDAAGIAGETWNWRIPSGQLNAGHMSFEHTYVEQTTAYDVVGGGSREDAWSAGASFGLERKVWQQGDFGVDLGFGFSFFRKNNWYKSTVGRMTRTDTNTAGSYKTDVDMGNADVMEDPWTQNADGSYGAGTFDGPGPVLSVGDISVSHQWGDETTSTSTTSYRALSIRGDLQMYEFQLALKPYYELTDWFMLRGTLGVGVDYRNFNVKVSGHGGDSSDDWDCYMLCGLGAMVHHEGVCLGVDFLRKVFDDKLDIDTRYVEGSVRNASWMLRAYVGYEF